jgi:hypothetical protein
MVERCLHFDELHIRDSGGMPASRLRVERRRIWNGLPASHLPSDRNVHDMRCHRGLHVHERRVPDGAMLRANLHGLRPERQLLLGANERRLRCRTDQLCLQRVVRMVIVQLAVHRRHAFFHAFHPALPDERRHAVRSITGAVRAVQHQHSVHLQRVWN